MRLPSLRTSRIFLPTLDTRGRFFGEDLVNLGAPARRVILTEDVVKIAGQQAQIHTIDFWMVR